MQSADTLLTIIHERGKRGLPLTRAYRYLYQPELFLRAYGRIYRNDGAMTPGANEETVDGMSLEKIHVIIQALREERYQWKPVRRIYIEKKHSTKKRPLGLPTWSDKLVQEVLRLILEPYFEPQFCLTSHGFRPGRGPHTALTNIYHTWKGTGWFIEGDISQCFDKLDHTVLLSLLKEKLQDNRLLRLIQGYLQAGYLEDWRFNTTLSGVPQGGVLSPLLSNIYLDQLDKFVETCLIPVYTRGSRRQPSRAYTRLQEQAKKLEQKGQWPEAKKLRRQMQQLPSRTPTDPDYRRLRYVRYADDFLLGFCGPRQEAEVIKTQLAVFLQDSLKLELSQTKTLITHARSEAAHFLGYEVTVLADNQQHDHRSHRSINGQVGLRVPLDVVQAKCRPYLRNNEPVHRAERMNDSVYSIVSRYQQEYRGIVEYYQLAYNRHRFNHLRWIMEQSLAKTLAHKLRITVSKVIERYQTTIQTDQGPRKVLQVTVKRDDGKRPLVTHWGGISLARRQTAILNDRPLPIWNNRTEIEKRLLAETCELCGSQDNVQVHHIRALKDLRRQGRADKPRWVQIMAARRRKTLVVCRSCHQAIHAGRPTKQHVKTTKTLESRVR